MNPYQETNFSFPFGIVFTILFVVVGIFLVRAFKKRNKMSSLEKKLLLENASFSRLVSVATRNMTGFDFEVWVKELLLSLGVKAKTTPRFNDHGIDVIAEYNGKKIGIQCKKYYARADARLVGEPVIRDLYGVKFADNYHKVMVITTGNFSPEAMAWAKGKPGLELVNGKMLEQIIMNRRILLGMLE